jgi:2'-5' RNA ligase
MGRSNVYSLWLMPEGDIYEILSSTIMQLAKPYATPHFEPHVTLLGHLTGPVDTMLAKTSKLANRLPQYEIALQSLDYMNEFFRCLYLRVHQTDDLMHAHMTAKEIMGEKRNADFMPHLSLMYGDIDTGTKQAIIKTIGNDLSFSFETSNLHLYSTKGAPTSWHKIAQFTLSAPRSS